MADRDASERAIPQEQYEHLSRAMRHLGRVDDRALPDDVAEYIEETWVELDDLYSRVER